MASSLQDYTRGYTDALDTGLDVDKLDISRRLSQEIYEKKKKERAEYYAMVNKLLAVGMKGYTEWKEGTDRVNLLNQEYEKRGIDAKASYNLWTGELIGTDYDIEGNLIPTTITGGEAGMESNLLRLDDWQAKDLILENIISSKASIETLESYQKAVEDYGR